MPLVITCSKCKQRYVLSYNESKVVRQVIKTQEQLDSILCPDCENEKETQMNKTIIVKNVDMYLLHRQKQELYYIIMNPRIHRMSDKTYDALHGLLHFLDACVDADDEGE